MSNLLCVLDTGVKIGADLILIQEPPLQHPPFETTHPAFQFHRAKNTWTAIRIDRVAHITNINNRTDLALAAQGDVQILDITITVAGMQATQIRIFHVYDHDD